MLAQKNIQLDTVSYLARDMVGVISDLDASLLNPNGKAVQVRLVWVGGLHGRAGECLLLISCWQQQANLMKWDYNTSVGSQSTTLFEKM